MCDANSLSSQCVVFRFRSYHSVRVGFTTVSVSDLNVRSRVASVEITRNSFELKKPIGIDLAKRGSRNVWTFRDSAPSREKHQCKAKTKGIETEGESYGLCLML